MALKATDILHERKFDAKHNLQAILAEDFDLIKNYEKNNVLNIPKLESCYKKDPFTFSFNYKTENQENVCSLYSLNPNDKTSSMLLKDSDIVLGYEFSANGI